MCKENYATPGGKLFIAKSSAYWLLPARHSRRSKCKEKRFNFNGTQENGINQKFMNYACSILLLCFNIHFIKYKRNHLSRLHLNSNSSPGNAEPSCYSRRPTWPDKSFPHDFFVIHIVCRPGQHSELSTPFRNRI